MGAADRETLRRFHTKIIDTPRHLCWIWGGGFKNDKGYGDFRFNGRCIHAHRASYELHVGAIPKGMLVLHSCDYPPCVNPAHLFLGTNGDNLADRQSKGRQARGESVNTAKLTSGEVLSIRGSRKTDMELSVLYGVSRGQISRIKNRTDWRHLP